MSTLGLTNTTSSPKYDIHHKIFSLVKKKCIGEFSNIKQWKINLRTTNFRNDSIKHIFGQMLGYCNLQVMHQMQVSTNLPFQKLRRIIKSKHFIIIFNIVFIKKCIQLLQLQKYITKISMHQVIYIRYSVGSSQLSMTMPWHVP